MKGLRFAIYLLVSTRKALSNPYFERGGYDDQNLRRGYIENKSITRVHRHQLQVIYRDQIAKKRVARPRRTALFCLSFFGNVSLNSTLRFGDSMDSSNCVGDHASLLLNWKKASWLKIRRSLKMFFSFENFEK